MFYCKLSDNLEIRLIEDRHSAEFFALVEQNYERLRNWCPWLDDVETIEKAHQFIDAKLRRFADGNGFTAGFFEKDSLTGVIALEYIDWTNRNTEIGYWLGAEAEGRGLITKASSLLIEYAFRELKMNRVQIRCASDNLRSRAIPEKLGFKQEGTMRQVEKLSDRYVDLVIYGILASEWQSNKH
jgi:ribosomal-protein-serine acetyltransferase